MRKRPKTIFVRDVIHHVRRNDIRYEYITKRLKALNYYPTECLVDYKVIHSAFVILEIITSTNRTMISQKKENPRN